MSTENPSPNTGFTEDSMQPIACSLAAHELKNRRQYVRTQLGPYLHLTHKGARELSLSFSNPIELGDVEEFVALESQCCSFLDFRITQMSDAVTLHISGPVGSEKVIDMFAEAASQ